MANLSTIDQRRALDRWIRNQGYADFDTYLAIGGSAEGTRQNLLHELTQIHAAIAAIEYFMIDKSKRPPTAAQTAMAPTIGPDALAAAEADAVGEPVDADNAQIQGFDHAGD